MADEIKTNDNKVNSVFSENVSTLMSPEGLQKYVFGTKKNGTPRAIYDIVKDYTKPKKKKKGKKKKNKNDDIPMSYSFYLSTKKGKKKKKNKKKNDHWHI